MSLSQIELKIKALINKFYPNDFIYDFLLAYDTPKSVIARLRKGQLNLSKNADEIILKKKLFYKIVTTEEIQTVVESIKKNATLAKNQIRFIMVTDHKTIAAVDTKTNVQIETAITNLLDHVTFFLPLAGMETYTAPTENDADVKAAVQMAKLFDEIKKNNPTETAEQVHNLNIFLSRLLFCFFAEDTGIFTKHLFTGSISSHTQPDGSDLGNYLQQLFDVLNIEERDAATPTYLKDFPYVNGGLFRVQIPLPVFTFKSRKAIIESGGENWAAINPDIFGSMIQAVVTPEKRGSLGMHYTSVPNIMKVIKPLFLNELEEELAVAQNNPAALNKLLARIANIRVFDPACGSGNFLIIAYKELRALEIEILLQLKGGQANSPTGFEEKQQQLFAKKQLTLAGAKRQSTQIELFSRIELNHFFGIELDDFAHEVAKLSLWLAQHQMNVEFNKLIGTTNPSLPLRDAGIIVQGNATRLDWETVCPKPRVGEVFILGNPPYLGGKGQSSEQKLDMELVFTGNKNFKELDYIACWFLIASNYLDNNSRFSFVTTSSLCEGAQVEQIWPLISNNGNEIFFAYSPFNWTNNAKDKAGVTCTIIGVRKVRGDKKYLYQNNIRREVPRINGYLTINGEIYITKNLISISKLPAMITGNSPYEGGNLLLTPEEKNNLLLTSPEAKKFLKKVVGSNEFLNAIERWCIWIEEQQLEEAIKIPQIKERIDLVKKFRMSGGEVARGLVDRPYQFRYTHTCKNKQLVIPRVSSSRREYIPIGFLDRTYIISDSAQAIYDSETYIFAIVSSKIHMLWVRLTSGRLRGDIRYLSALSYNTFPFPSITSTQKIELEKHVHNILEQRAKHTEKTLSEMYDPEDMPEGLLQAHQNLDVAIEQCYRSKPFESDEERLAYLFKMYEEMIEAEKTRGTLFAAEPTIKKSKKK
jgi:hypothetical protein